MGIMEFDFKSQEDEITNSVSSPTLGKAKNVKGIIWGCSSLSFHF